VHVLIYHQGNHVLSTEKKVFKKVKLCHDHKQLGMMQEFNAKSHSCSDFYSLQVENISGANYVNFNLDCQINIKGCAGEWEGEFTKM